MEDISSLQKMFTCEFYYAGLRRGVLCCQLRFLPCMFDVNLQSPFFRLRQEGFFWATSSVRPEKQELQTKVIETKNAKSLNSHCRGFRTRGVLSEKDVGKRRLRCC